MRVPILMYHRVGNTDAGDSPVKPAEFARQMEFLAASGYRVVNLQEIVLALHGNTRLAPKTVAITFDDGFEDTCEHATPVLTKMGIPATFFLVTGLMGQRASWLSAGPRLLSWNEARGLLKDGFSVGSHSMTHRRLNELDDQNARKEIDGSKRLLEDGLGSRVCYFAYPYGNWTNELGKRVAAAGYDAACSTESGFNNEQTHRYALRRLEIDGRDSIRSFARSLTFGENHAPFNREISYYSQRMLEKIGIRLVRHGS